MNVAVMTSGGDVPGMNAAIRAVVRYSDKRDFKIFGISYGYLGLCETNLAKSINHFRQLNPSDVCLILSRGGTFLKSIRYPQFESDPDVRIRALKNLKYKRITALLIIGGDGSFRGAYALYKTNQKCKEIKNLRIVCIPATIDNDIPYTKYSIGADTAVNTAVECIDKIRDTAYAHKRVFVVQVMGRNCDYLPAVTGVACGAHVVLCPSHTVIIDDVVNEIETGFKAGKDFEIIIVAEGIRKIVKKVNNHLEDIDADYKKSSAAEIIMRELMKALSPEYQENIRPVVLGHVQRGGGPSSFDRVLATWFGVAAIETLEKWPARLVQPQMLAIQNKGEINSRLNTVPLSKVIKAMKTPSPGKYNIYEQIYKMVTRGHT